MHRWVEMSVGRGGSGGITAELGGGKAAGPTGGGPPLLAEQQSDLDSLSEPDLERKDLALRKRATEREEAPWASARTAVNFSTLLKAPRLPSSSARYLEWKSARPPEIASGNDAPKRPARSPHFPLSPIRPPGSPTRYRPPSFLQPRCTSCGHRIDPGFLRVCQGPTRPSISAFVVLSDLLSRGETAPRSPLPS